MKAALVLVALLATQAAEWPAHRGGPARTGNVDGKPGPRQPKVLWVYRSKEHFIPPLAASGDRLYACVLGAFNTGSVHSFEAAASRPPVWSKRAPTLRYPTVGSPVIAEGKVVFGEGMHQTDGTTLHAIRATDGRALWRLDVPGELVHIEASASIAGGRVYAGGGSAGVICVELNRVVLGGKEQPLAEAEAAVDAQWKKMLEAYEVDKKKDPDFAIPPNEVALPKPAPRQAWQKGQGAWHVDAPVLVASDRVYVSSAYLDKEKKGERALICLNAADGSEVWKAPLALNPWGGATLAGGKVLVSCSNMRYDPKEIPSAKGEVVALSVADGKVEWRRELPAAVLGTVAVSGDLAVVADTSGHVQALELASGKTRWTTKTGAPYFAGTAVAGDAVYAADLDGSVHAVSLSDGKPKWKLDLAADGAVKAPGMVYGAPIVHGGRVYVGTCNLEGKAMGGETVIVCIGE